VDDFKKMFNCLGKGIIPEEMVYSGPEHDNRAPSIQKVSAIIRKLTNNRAPREDNNSSIS
jgi:hypothetical protein